RDDDGDKHHGPEPGQHLAVHGEPPRQLLPLLNICALPAWYPLPGVRNRSRWMRPCSAAVARSASVSASARPLAEMTAIRSESCCDWRARSWLPACVACNAPVAPWLWPTKATISARLLSILPTAPA